MQNKWPVVGHRHILNFLEGGLQKRRPAQVYLFLGPKKVGKMAVATRLCQLLICEKYNQVVDELEVNVAELGCGTCPTCRMFQKGLYADYYLLERDVEEQKQMISVRQVRELQEHLSKRSFQNSHKIVLVPEAELLSDGASNSLLKFLEEPTVKTVVILIATNRDAILPTVISRSQVLNFLPVASEEIYHYLVSIDCDRDKARSIAALANGRPTLAEKWHREPEVLRAYQEQVLKWLEILRVSRLDKFRLLEAMVGKEFDRDAALQALEILMSIGRDVALSQQGNDNYLINLFADREVKAVAGVLTRASQFVAAVEQARQMISQNVNPRLVFENLLIT